MTETQPAPLSTADVKRRYSWGMAPHKSIPGGMYTVVSAAADFDRWLTAHDAEVRADERAKLQDRIEELEKNLSYEVEQKIKLADTLRDERAKRPDREQIDRIQFEIDNVHQIHGDTCLCGFTSSRSRSRTEHLTALFADAVLSSLALEPEAREEPLIECPHWESGRLTKRKGCTACAAEAREVTDAERTEYRVHYSYGVNSGTQCGGDAAGIVESIERWSQGRIDVDAVESRTIRESAWAPDAAALEAARKVSRGDAQG